MARRPKAPKQWPEFWRKAWDEVRPDDDGNRDLTKVTELAIQYVREDPEQAEAMAVALVARLKRELTWGVTQPVTNQLTLPGFDSEEWRPDELYAAKGKACRAEDARPFMVAQKAEAAMADAVTKLASAHRQQTRANLYNAWFTAQIQEGRDARTLTQGVWLHESGYLSPP